MDSGNFLGYSDFRIVFVYWPCHVPCGILVPQPEIESMPFALKARSLNHWTAREVHGVFFVLFCFVFFGEHSSFCAPGFNSFLQSYRSVADLQCCVNFYCRAKGFSDTHTFFFIVFSIMVYHRVLNIVPCAVQEDLVAHPFYIQ